MEILQKNLQKFILEPETKLPVLVRYLEHGIVLIIVGGIVRTVVKQGLRVY
jgi:hypothetical protein